QISRTSVVQTKGLWPELRKLGVTGEKQIPASYLRGSVEQRRDLLAGLMDSDGGVDGVGLCRFTNCNKNLIDGVLDLLRSLGEIGQAHGPYLRERCKPHWVVDFYPTICPFRLSRKAARFAELSPGPVRKYHRHFICSIEPVEPRDTACIAVTGESHLFLAGESYIPTHNTEEDGETLNALEQYG